MVNLHGHHTPSAAFHLKDFWEPGRISCIFYHQEASILVGAVGTFVRGPEGFAFNLHSTVTERMLCSSCVLGAVVTLVWRNEPLEWDGPVGLEKKGRGEINERF